VSLGQAEGEIVGRRGGERLVERCSDRRLLHVDGLDLAELPLRARGQGQPAELRQVSGTAHPRSGRSEERLRSEEVAERVFGLGADLADEERVRADLAAELRERGRDEWRAALPSAVPVLIERGVELVAPRGQQRTRPLLRRGMRIREHVERRDTDHRGTGAPCDALRRSDRDAQAGERAGPGRDGHLVDGRKRDARARQQALDRREQLVPVPAMRVPGLLGEHVVAVVQRDRGPRGRRIKRQESHENPPGARPTADRSRAARRTASCRRCARGGRRGDRAGALRRRGPATR